MKKIQPAFENRELARKLRVAAKTWVGTNYAHMGIAKGESNGKGGVDCTKLMGLIMVELGILRKVEYSYYGRDWYIYGDMEVVLMAFTEHMARYLDNSYEYQLLKYCQGIELVLGDVICFTMKPEKGLVNHTALYMGKNKILHAVEGRGVSIMDYSDHWREKARFIYRIMLSATA